MADEPKFVFPAGTPMEDVINTIELLAKGSLGNDKKIVELVKVVSEGARRGDTILLEGLDKLGKSMAGLIETVKNLQQRVSMLEQKETKH